VHSSASVGLRLYRPGFELIEIKSWGRADKIDWKVAAGLEVQEGALDKLFPVDGHTSGKEAFLFGASEYERLAANVLSDDDRARLDSKAKALREIAGETVVDEKNNS